MTGLTLKTHIKAVEGIHRAVVNPKLDVGRDGRVGRDGSASHLRNELALQLGYIECP